MLDKLRIDFTKSRPRQTNDNALVECKNGAVVRKTMGYSHILQKHAAAINRFYAETRNPYLNFHHPCCFASPSAFCAHIGGNIIKTAIRQGMRRFMLEK